PPPFSPTQRDEIGRLLRSSGRTPPHQLMLWRLRLYSGHVVERTAHYTHKTVQAAFTASRACPECGLEPATVVNGEPIGLQEEPPRPQRATTPAKTTRSGKPTKAELEARVRELEAEAQRLKKD